MSKSSFLNILSLLSPYLLSFLPASIPLNSAITATLFRFSNLVDFESDLERILVGGWISFHNCCGVLRFGKFGIDTDVIGKNGKLLLSLLCFHVLLVSVLAKDVMFVRKDREEKFLCIGIGKGGGFGGGFGCGGGAGRRLRKSLIFKNHENLIVIILTAEDGECYSEKNVK